MSDWYTRVTLPGRQRRAHLIPGHGSPSSGYPAVCGTAPPVFHSWHGTGTHAERERAAALPLCKNCERLSA